MGLLIFFFILSIAFSFLCSILEAVLLSVTPSYVTQQSQAKTITGRLLKEYKEDIDKPLSAILTLNTIAHTVGAIGVGAQAGHIFGNNSIGFLGLSLSFEAIIAGLMTLAILILSEIIPKTLGANNWKNLAPFTAKTIKILNWILSPFVWMSQGITRSLKKDKGKSVLSRADFAAMTTMGETSGALAKEESEIIKNLLNFSKRKVRDIMTPRTVAFTVEDDITISEIMQDPQSSIFSRIPVYNEDIDNVIGIILMDDVLSSYYKEKKDQNIKDLVRPVNFVNDQMGLQDLFNDLTEEKQHMSIVKDEFGNVVGLVTMEDLFETLLGKEIVDESDEVVDLQAHAKELAKEQEEEE